VIIWGERLPAQALSALLSIAGTLGLAGREGAGLLEVPAGANSRGLREAGVLPNAAPGYGEPPHAPGREAAEIAAAAATGELSALYLLETDPVRDRPDRALWERAMHHAGLVVAHASVLTEGLREHAHVIFPAESSAEKEGTVVHPDGRLQRLRAAIGHHGDVRAGWSVIADVAKRCGHDLGVLTSGMAFAQLARAVPFYAGITLDEIAGQGVRWPAREAALSMPAGTPGSVVPGAAMPAPAVATPAASGGPGNGALRVGTYRPIWASPEVEISPSLKFLAARQQVEISPDDAARLGLHHGAGAVLSANGTRLQATVAVRTGVPAGSAFIADGLAEQSANQLTETTVEVTPA
jgi:NADH-quinone oxidoreductase subunit G